MFIVSASAVNYRHEQKNLPKRYQARAIAATIGDVRVLNLYVPNGKAVGDFNITPADLDVHDPDAWRDKILCSAPERQALADILALGYRDAYRNLHPDTVQYSWWDYRMGGLRRNIGMRIDLTLCSDNLALHDAGIDCGGVFIYALFSREKNGAKFRQGARNGAG